MSRLFLLAGLLGGLDACWGLGVMDVLPLGVEGWNRYMRA